MQNILNQKLVIYQGGQKQRLNLLLSLIHNPKLMILDEFVTGLDIKSVRNIITYVNKLKIKNNASMILISHQPEEIEQLSDRVILLRDGKIASEQTVAEILTKYQSVSYFLEEEM